jgi:enoyl-CoA hydratase/carnithine racemase
MSALVEVWREGAAAVIALRREEKLNALSSALEAALGDVLEHPDVRARADRRASRRHAGVRERQHRH